MRNRARAHLGVADVQVAVWLWREARHDLAARARQVLRQLGGAVGDAHDAALVAEVDGRVDLWGVYAFVCRVCVAVTATA